MDISESSAMSNYSKGGMQPKVMVDIDLSRKLEEAHGKITVHADWLAEYEGWKQVFAANSTRTLSLDADDYLYFYGTK